MSDSELEIAAASYSRGDWKDAFNRYKELAETGCVECQRFVGWMYFRGEGVNVDLEKAMYWLKEAAQAGDQEAAFWGLVVHICRNRSTKLHTVGTKKARKRNFCPLFIGLPALIEMGME